MLKSLVHRPASGARAASVELIFNKTPGGSREVGGRARQGEGCVGTPWRHAESLLSADNILPEKDQKHPVLTGSQMPRDSWLSICTVFLKSPPLSPPTPGYSVKYHHSHRHRPIIRAHSPLRPASEAPRLLSYEKPTGRNWSRNFTCSGITALDFSIPHSCLEYIEYRNHTFLYRIGVKSSLDLIQQKQGNFYNFVQVGRSSH